MSALQFKWLSKPSDRSENASMGGFRLEWGINGTYASTNRESSKTGSFWNRKLNLATLYKNVNVMTTMNLVRQSKINNVDEDEVWRALLRNRWGEKILLGSPCLAEHEEYSVISDTAKDLNLVMRGVDPWANEEDLVLGMQLYSIIHSCPSNLVEAAKLSLFFENLLTNHSLNSVVAATMHSIQPMAGDNVKDFTAVNMWYERLARRYNFSLGSNIHGLLTSEKLKNLLALDPPYMKDNKSVANDTILLGKIKSTNPFLKHPLVIPIFSR